MEISEFGLDLIKKHEGCRLVGYLDSVGVATIGYGSTYNVTPGMRITQAEADDRLKNDVKAAENCVNKCVSVPLTQNEFDALCSLVFNIGCGNFRKSTLLNLLNQNRQDEAAIEFTKWDKAGGHVLAGLTARRHDDTRLFESA